LSRSLALLHGKLAWPFTFHFSLTVFLHYFAPSKKIEMAERKIVTPGRIPVRESAAAAKQKVAVAKKQRPPLFEKDNYMWMGIGALVVAIGMFLMAGGKNENPNEFDYKLVYSTTRITIAPILILAGFVIEIYAIFKRPKAAQQ
jgi:hypothetical protein